MANDNMRTGPRGASDQEAWQSPLRMKVPVLVGQTALNTANVAAITALEWGNSPLYVINQNLGTNSHIGIATPGFGSIATGGVNWRLTRLTAVCTTTFAGGQSTSAFTVGLYAFNPATAAITVVDADCFCTSLTLSDTEFSAAAGGAGLATSELALNGVGAYRNDNGGTGTGLVSYELGDSTGQNQDDGTPIAGFPQFLGFSIGDGAQAAGGFVIYAEFVPSSGQFFGG